MFFLTTKEDIGLLLTLGDMFKEFMECFDRLAGSDWMDAENRIAEIQTTAAPLIEQFSQQYGSVTAGTRDMRLRVREFANAKVP